MKCDGQGEEGEIKSVSEKDSGLHDSISKDEDDVILVEKEEDEKQEKEKEPEKSKEDNDCVIGKVHVSSYNDL